MWQLKKISFTNLFSHEDSEFEFKNGTCSLIVGENRDGGGNNGAGKSTVFEAIALALTNKSLRDLKKESFINRDSENCTVCLSLENKVLKSTLKITRQYFRGSKPVRVEIEEDGEINSEITSVDEANKRVFDLIGISRDDLLRYFIISQDNRYTFFTAGDVEKKEVLNRITSADMINPLIERLSDDKKRKDGERYEVNEKTVYWDSKKTTLEEQLQELTNEDNSEEIKEIEDKIERIKARIESRKEDLQELRERQEEVKKQRDSIRTEDVSELLGKRDKLRKRLEETEEMISKNNRIRRMAESDIDAAVKCPECGAEFISESNLNLSVEETRGVITAVDSDNKTLSDLKRKFNGDIDKINVKIRESEKLQQQKDSLERAVRKNNADIATLEDDIATFNAKTKKYLSEIKELKESKKNASSVKSLETKIEECGKNLVELKKRGEEIDGELEMINYWIYYMGKSGFMTFIANRAISLLEGTVNSFLKKFKSSVSVNINGFKVLRDGSVREKIEVFALENGMNAELFMSKSGGERARINLAGVLAIQHLINMSSGDKGLDIIILDESFAGIDSEGLESVIRILENLGVTVIMITQNVSSDFNNDNKVLVVKENGVSKIVM